MKNYKKALFTLSMIATLPLMAANENDTTIYVNTFADEDGENSNTCSLRQAIKAAAMNKAYAGCSAGKTSASLTDSIQLQAGEYILNSPLTPSSQVNILGATAVSWDKKDAITGDYPERLPLQTKIKGTSNFSFFDTTGTKATLTLNNLLLEGDKAKPSGAERGGAIISGGGLSLNRVVIQNTLATESGGAIYLSGIGTSLSMSDSVIQNSNAPKGSVLAMSCLDNLGFTARTITMKNSSIVNNGNASSTSTIDFCGAPSIDLTANTIAYNTAKSNIPAKFEIPSSIIKFSTDSFPDANNVAQLSSSSSLRLVSNTIVNNTAYATFLYDSIGAKSLVYNLLAYNEGYSCQHLLGGLAEGKTGSINLSYNGLIKSATTKGFCDVPYNTLQDRTTVDLTPHLQNTVMSSLQSADKADEYTAYMPMYFLLDVAKNPLVNVPETTRTCSTTDQRGISRFADGFLILDPNSANSCDIGSTELVKLSAADMSSQNVSQVSALESYEKARDDFQAALDDKNTEQEFSKYYEIRRDEYIKLIENYKNNAKYRQVHFDIFNNSVPHQLNQSGKLEIQHFDASLYNVEVTSIGTGPDAFESGIATDLPNKTDPALKCEWNKDLQQVLMYRTDNELSASNFGYCKYTISLKSNASVKSTGVVQAEFVNIAPIAKNDQYIFKSGTEQRVKLDLLANDSDDGDGKIGQINYPNSKSQFYVDPVDNVSAPIKLGKIDSNLMISAEIQRPCPDQTRTTCYGGDIYIQPKNSFNVFNYSFTYQVFDANGVLSNEAKVTLTSDDSGGSRSGGGGSFGWISVISFIGLVLLRRRYSF